jgi:predicted ATPase/DNA-binding CsgD family transcriptional regulator
MDERVLDNRQSHTASEQLMTARKAAAMLSGNQRSLSGRVPTPPTSLIGREREVAAIRELLHPPAGHRLIVLTGPGGVGKTRLALSVAAEAASVFADGVAYVPLAAIRDSALVIAVIAKAVGVRETGDRPLVEQITARVADQQRLFVLDNFEHVLDAGPMVGELLASCPRLRLSGEHDFPVPPLTLPDKDGQSASWPDGQTLSREIEQSAAVELFVARARAVNAGFTLTEENASAVAEVCRWLDGLPLAIELAAARAAVLSPVALLTRLNRRLPFLTDGPRDAPARQRTLRDTIAWSYDLLDAAAQTLFRHLAVFAGGFSADAAAWISGIESADAFALVSSLVDNSLLQPGEGSDGEPRFGMLETIREYGLEQLQARGEWDRARRLHAEHCLAFAEAVEPKLRGRDQGAQLALLETEHDNLRAALTWSLEEADRAEYGLRLAGALHWFWFLHDHYREGRQWLEAALARPPTGERTQARVKALAGAGLLAIHQNDYAAARDRLRQSFALGRALRDTAGVTYALHVLGMWDLLQADHAELRSLVEESVVLFREAGDHWGLATALCTLGMVAIATFQFEEARALFAESLALSRELGDTWGLARGLHYSGELARFDGDRGRARVLYEESLVLYDELDHRGAAAIVRHNLGYLAQHRGDPRQALAHFADALVEHVASGDQQNTGLCLGGVAGMVALLGQPEQAARLFGAVDALFERIGSSIWPIDLVDYDANLAAVRDDLGQGAFDAAFAAGRELPLERAIAEAFAARKAIETSTGVGDAAPGEAIPAAAIAFGLTPREWEVLRLLARRGTDREIADALSISPRTVMHHVSRILAKLGVENRRDAAAWATQHGID